MPTDGGIDGRPIVLLDVSVAIALAREEHDAQAEARAGILATAGILPNAPDWPEWQAQVRGRSADERRSDEDL